MRGYRSNGNVEELLKQSQMELSWIQRQLAMISIRNTHLHTKGKPRHEASSLQTSGQSVSLNRFRLLEAGNRALKLKVATLQQEKQQRRTLKAKLHAALQEQHRLNLELINHTVRSTKYDQVRSDYEQLRRTFVLVRRERDAARQDRTELQVKVEKLEEVLKHMHNVAKERQRLQIEHERALELLHGKQREIDLLQRAPLEAEHEHEGAVHLLEVKVRDLEHKCRSQRDQFQQLLNLRSELETAEVLAADSFSLSRIHQQKNLPQILSTPQIETGDESVANTQPLIDRSLLPRPPPQTRPRERSSAAATNWPSSPRLVSPSEMEDEVSPSPRSKARYTGQVRLCSARYSYNPYDGPNEHPEAELPLVAGKYLYVYGNMDDDGFYEGELLDGQRGLVPSNFVEFVQDKEKLAIQAGDEGEELGQPGHTQLSIMGVDGGGTLDGGILCSANALGPCSNGMEEGPPDPEDLAEDVVPYPRRINLIKQLARSVIVGWDPPLASRGWSGSMSGYAVLVDGELRATVPLGGRTKCLLEKLDLDGCVHRVSVQSTTERGPSDELRCTLLVGANVVVAPCGLRVDDIQRDTAELSWLPSNSNYGHTIFLDGVEHAVVKPGRYRLRFVNLKAMTVYKVTVVARPHQVPWQLPLEQREKKEAGVEFCTQAAGPPLAPQEVQVLCGQAPGVLQVHWKPPPLSPTGTSNGANVIGYVVCTKGQRIAEVLYPLADYVSVELTRIQCLEAREVIVRTLSAQGESQDSPVAVIPNNLLNQPHPHGQTLPQPHPQPRQPHAGDPHPGGPHPGPHPGGPPGQPHPQAQPRPPNCQPQPLHLQPHQGLRPQHRLPLIPHPHPHPHPMPQRPVSARDMDAKEHGGAPPPPGRPSGWDPPRMAPPPPGQPGAWDQARMAPLQVHTLEAPPSANPRSPSPQRILPQPRGTLIPDTVAKAIAREAAQRVAAESGKGERRQGGYGEQPFHQQHSDDEDEDEEGSARGRRRGPSVDEFLRGSELGRPPHYSHSEEYHSESSRGSDLSDILEEDEEELYSEMQLNDEGRRRNSHHALKAGSSPGGRQDRENGRRGPQGSRSGPQPQRRPLMVPSIDGYRERERRSPPYYNDSQPEESFRIFVALFDYDPLSMSPNPDAADEELPFKEGQIIRVYGDKDTDGFYRGEVCGRMGLIPCNMVSEIRAEDDETLDQLIKQGFLPLNTPIDRIEQNRRGQRRDQATRRMVALYDYDPRESSPNVDVEAELTFCAGDIMAVFGEIDEDGFYYGDINGHRGLVPSNFLEEVPDDVEVYLTDTPSHHHHHPQEEPSGRAPANSSHSSSAANAEGKRVATETTDIVPMARTPSPMVRPLLPGTMRPISPARGSQGPSDPRDSHDGDPRDSHDMKKKKGILSKGKKLLKRLSPVNK
ncbi:unnamed protein product [Lota lota]